MDRREAVKRVAFIMGGTLSAPVLAGMLNGCQPEEAPDWVPSFLTKQEDELVTAIADLIIPDTDTPGAKAALVNRYADKLVRDCFTPEEQEAFRIGLVELDALASTTKDQPFAKLKKEDQVALLTQLEQEAMTQRAAGGSRHFWFTIKEITLVGYFTSEIGATQALSYQAVPGSYQGCIPLQPGQKAWAT